MKIPPIAADLSTLGFVALVAATIAGCPQRPEGDDDSAQVPAVAPVESAEVTNALAWPHDPDDLDTVPVSVADLCPAVAADVELAREAMLLGDVDAAEVQLQAYVAAGGEPDASARLVLGALLARSGQHEDALSFLLDESLGSGPLAGDAAELAGKALEELERWDEAAAAYERVPPENRLFDRARVRLAALALRDDRPQDAITALLPLLSDPAELGSRYRPEGLHMLGQAYEARGDDGDTVRAYEAYRTAWSTAPLSSVAGDVKESMDALEAQVPAEHHPTVYHRFARAAAYHEAGHWNSALKAIEAIEDDLPGDDPQLTCEAAYIRGRALYKRRKYTDAGPHLESAMGACASVETDLAAKATYIRAKSLDKLGEERAAIVTWKKLPATFPGHSYADDGFLNAALMELDEGNPAAAQSLLTDLVQQFPEGDMAGEARWRLAWTAYKGGDQPEALAQLRHLEDEYASSHDRQSYLRARYWEAKMVGWPDGEGHVVQRAPEAPGPAPDLEAAADLWASLADEHPLSYYGALAHSRLAMIDPQRAAAVSERVDARRLRVAGAPALPEVWDVDARLWDQPGLDIARALICTGMRPEGISELNRVRSTVSPWDWQTEQLIAHLAATASDHHTSHNTLRVRFRTDHPEQLGAGSWSAFHLAYPLAFGGNVRGAVADKQIPQFLLQALVREESAFQTEVKSWAGAMGLSQLMWATARETARKMGIKGLTKADLADPDTNLAIGAFYLQRMSNHFQGNLPCAVGSYNAGPGAMGRWLDVRGGYPLDEFVEEVPYNETRNYIKRVFESYQIYSQIYDGDPTFVPMPSNVPER
jgi:soluble lytic murein transglycosylase